MASNKILLTFKASPDEAARWRMAFARDGAVMSEICRKALDRFAARSERKAKDNAQVPE